MTCGNKQINKSNAILYLKNAVFWDMARIDLVCPDVSKKLIASNFRVEKSTSEACGFLYPEI
jgi:hypothetical protein